MNVLNLTRSAFEKGEVKSLLLGLPPYAIPVSQYTPVSIPTNYERLLMEGLFPLIATAHDKSLYITPLEDAIIALLHSGPNEIFYAYMFALWLTLKRQHATYTLSEPLRQELAYVIARSRFVLESTTHNWLGHVSTLYQDITSLEKALNERGFRLL